MGDTNRHVVAIFGGACAGSTAADLLAARGVEVVVFEQNLRPYGKIEDGLPRWHRDQRRMEYRRIDGRLDKPGVHFVPRTRLGADITFEDVTTWGFSAVLLANGAWRDRPLDVPEADRWVDRGLVYQNPFIYWFNHACEAGYAGRRYDVPVGALCIGGGLASIDVVKVFQLETYGRALRARGIDVSMHDLEHAGIPATCTAHGIADPRELGVEDAWLLYRRRVEDMPLATPPDGATPEQVLKIEAVRKKMLAKAQEKFLFRVRPMALPTALLIEDDHVAGVRFVETEMRDGKAVPVPDKPFELRSPLVVSAIGSLPEPLPGIVMKGTFYDYADWGTGAYAPVPGVFGVGNVVTGRGNIKASELHAKDVARHLLEHYLGIQSPDASRDVSGLATGAEARAEAAVEQVATYLDGKAPLPAAAADALLARARARQAAVGFDDYRSWMARVTPPDAE
jgi:NADPH-dependent glutamate synthase beta subunit-like oxidoreductase